MADTLIASATDMHDSTMHSMSNPHSSGSTQHMDHAALNDLIQNMNQTHMAVNSGSWFDPDTWMNGKVPGSGAKVLIPEGISVTYDARSNARIDTVAIEGELSFAENKNTKLVVETILNADSGTLEIGSETRSVAADRTAQIIFTSNRAIGDNAAWDPTQLSKGLVSHGEVSIHGADKLDAVALAGDALAGDNVLTLKESPNGWRVGDQIVLGGTARNSNGSNTDNSFFQDEVLTITAINGNQVSFINQDTTSGDNTRLRYDHQRPGIAERDQIDLYVANTTRNVSFETEGGDSVEIANRAHVMFMHNPNVQVKNAGFYQLGRSDKSKLVDDVGENVDGSIGNGTNPRGRYSLHFHRNGADDLNSVAAIADGNAIVGSPGWGIVHHDSHANVRNNVVFDVVGAGIVAESGNEIGIWEDNTVIKTTGAQTQYGLQHPFRRELFDFGLEGNAYWVQGAAQVQMRNNVAISSKETGLTLFGEALEGEFFKDVDTIAVKDLPPSLQKLFPADQIAVDVNDIPLREFKGFESYNTETGINFWGHMTNPDGQGEFLGGSGGSTKGAHEGKSKVEDFKLWGNSKGLHIIYSGNLSFDTGLIVSNKLDIQAGVGIKQNGATVNTQYNNLNIQGFFEGIDIDSPASYEEIDRNVAAIRNSRFTNNKYNLGKVGHDNTDFDAFMALENNVFEVHSDNNAPIARFTSETLGGTALLLSGADSYDTDPIEGGAQYPLRSQGIAAYGWDFDSDGVIDEFGRKVKHYFEDTGSQSVSLTVWDNQGAASTTTQRIDVQPVPYENAFANGDFSRVDPSLSKKKTVEGWITDGRAEDGVLMLSTAGKWDSFLHQTIEDDSVRRGRQTLSFDFKNIESPTTTNSSYRNEVSVLLWGINGQYEDNVRSRDGVQQIGTLPLQSELLLRQDFGGEEGDFFDWKSFSFDIDLDAGYEQLYFKVISNNAFGDGDVVAIDNVSLTGNGTSLQPTEPTTPGEVTEGAAILAPDAALIARLSFEEGEGAIASDTSVQGNSHTGYLKEGVEWVENTRMGGYAVEFDETSEGITIQNSTDINRGIHKQRTISLWFQAYEQTGSADDAEDQASSTKQVIYEEGGGARGLNIYVDEDRLFVGGWNQPIDESNWEGTWLSTDSFEPGSWQHVALVLEGDSTVSDEAFRAYFNGQLFGSGVGSQLWGHQGEIGIGSANGTTRFHSGSANEQSAFVGAIDELQIYNTALNAEEVQWLATSQVG